MKAELELQVDRAEVAPGTAVSGRVVCVAGGGCRTLKVTLEQRDRTPDYQGVARTVAEAVLHTGDLAGGENLPFTLVVPADAIPGYAGDHGRMFWGVHAAIDRAGTDVHAFAEIMVLPAG